MRCQLLTAIPCIYIHCNSCSSSLHCVARHTRLITLLACCSTAAAFPPRATVVVPPGYYINTLAGRLAKCPTAILGMGYYRDNWATWNDTSVQDTDGTKSCTPCGVGILSALTDLDAMDPTNVSLVATSSESCCESAFSPRPNSTLCSAQSAGSRMSCPPHGKRPKGSTSACHVQCSLHTNHQHCGALLLLLL